MCEGCPDMAGGQGSGVNPDGWMRPPPAMPGKTDGEEDPRVKPVPLFTVPLPALPPPLSQRP